MKAPKICEAIYSWRRTHFAAKGVMRRVWEFLTRLASLAVFSLAVYFLVAEAFAAIYLACVIPAPFYFIVVKTILVLLSSVLSAFYAASVPTKYSDTRYMAIPYLVLLVGTPFVELGGRESFIYWLAVFAIYFSALVFAENIVNPPIPQRPRGENERELELCAATRSAALFLGRNIRNWRVKIGMSERELARALDNRYCPSSFVRSLEEGLFPPYIDILAKMARILKEKDPSALDTSLPRVEYEGVDLTPIVENEKNLKAIVAGVFDMKYFEFANTQN
jgi:transcriptional regulator with XRE-family HTH domain